MIWSVTMSEGKEDMMLSDTISELRERLFLTKSVLMICCIIV